MFTQLGMHKASYWQNELLMNTSLEDSTLHSSATRINLTGGLVVSGNKILSWVQDILYACTIDFIEYYLLN